MNARPRNRRFARLMFVALVLTIPACGIASDNPPSDPNKAKVDEELLGTWENPDPNAQAYLKALTIEKLSRPGYPAGAMKVTLRPRDPDEPPKIWVIFSTELNGKRFAYHCGPAVEDPKQFPAWDKLSAKGYGIYKYKVSPKTLTLWEGGTALAKAVEAGKVKGKWAGGPYYSYIQLTDTTENLAKFLSSAEGNAVFGKEGVLKRVP